MGLKVKNYNTGSQKKLKLEHWFLEKVYIRALDEVVRNFPSCSFVLEGGFEYFMHANI